MRTVTPKATASPSIYLAIESPDSSERVKAQLSQLGCRCSHHSNLSSFEHLLKTETPSLVVMSLDFDGQCALQYCQDHPQLLDEIPIAFFAADPISSFDKAMKAVRLGALDVVTPPLEFAKLEKIASVAYQRLASRQRSTEAAFFVSEMTQSIAAQPPVKVVAGGPAAVFEEEEIAPLCAGIGEVLPQVPAGQNHAAMSQGRPIATPINSSKPDATNGLADHSSSQDCDRKESFATRVKGLESWILGTSPAMQEVRSIIAEVAETKANVMIYGASGTGKELVATAVHKLSNRSDGPFEPVNMTEIPHDLAESLLFGHERGTFTGADSRQIGVCEAADGGTLFLDEIGEMAFATQPKLLRFLQEGTVKRIGSRVHKKVDVRVITASNRNPDTIVKEGLMREDLFFRLHVVPIHIPPLHERPEDIEQLAMLFLHRYVKAYDRNVEGFTDEVLDIFRRHDWPGNVRQLENVVERLVVFAKGRLIEVPDIPAEIHAASMFDGVPGFDGIANGRRSSRPYSHEDAQNMNVEDDETAQAVASMSAMQRTERSAIVEALQLADGHVIDAAHLLGLGQATVYRKIKQYRIPHQRRRRRRTPK